jgi:opacity protein-like surface antigen
MVPVLAGAVLIAATASAQEMGAGAGRIEIGMFPGGGLFFTESSNGAEPGFGNYAYAGALQFNLSKWLGVEGEFGGGIGVKQNLKFNSLEKQNAPCVYAYSGNLVYAPGGKDRALVPYVAGGVGGLTLLKTSEVANLGLTSNETFLTGNAGGGLKWFVTQRVGVRADYRLLTVRHKDTAPAFFGQDKDNRYAHRFTVGFILTY